MPDVQLTWSLSPTKTSKVDGQRVYRSATSSPSFPSDYTQIASVGDGVTSYTDTGVSQGDYTYAVTAFNSAGESSPTADTVSAQEPTSLSVNAGADAEAGGGIGLARARTLGLTAGADAEAGGGIGLARARTLGLTAGADAGVGGAVVSRVLFSRLQYSALLGSTQRLAPAAGTADRDAPAAGATDSETPAAGTAQQDQPAVGDLSDTE